MIAEIVFCIGLFLFGMLVGALFERYRKPPYWRPAGFYKNTYMTLDEAKRCVGPGWGKLIEAAWYILPRDAHISQIKEKFGGLRLYIDHMDVSAIHVILSSLEHYSEVICENCGEWGKNSPVNGWWTTLCDSCRKRNN